MTKTEIKTARVVAERGIPAKPIFDFLKSRNARMACPFCGHEQWHGWDERITLEHVIGSKAVDRQTEAFPLTCANCGFIRFQSAHVLDDPRAADRNPRQPAE
jgi:predicted nucleic-acid-binding Zn-ribbon protein